MKALYIIITFFINLVTYSNSSSVKKCCPFNQIIQLNKSSVILATHSAHLYCIPSPNKTSTNTTDFNSALSDQEKSNFTPIIFEREFSRCRKDLSILDNSVDKWFEIRKNNVYVGLNFWFWPAWLSVEKNPHCVDDVQFYGLDSPSTELRKNGATQVLIFCGDIENFGAYLTHRGFYGSLYMISSVFVFLTLIIYVVLWEEQNTHGCAQFTFFTAVFFFYVLEGARILVKLNGFYIIPSAACFFHAVVAQYFFVSVNTTSAVLGFDLLWIFWNLDPNAYRMKNWKRIQIYSLISWLLPFLGITIGLIMHHYLSPEEALRNENGLFEFAHYRCSSPLWHLTFYAQAILFILNIFFFGATSFLIYQHRKTAAAVHSRRTQKHLSESIAVFSKLFFVLGMTWIAVIIEFFAGENNPLSYAWLTLRVLNLLLGVIYFLLFGVNQKNLKSLRQKYGVIERAIMLCGLNKFTEPSETIASSKGTQSTDNHIPNNKFGNHLWGSSDC